VENVQQNNKDNYRRKFVSSPQHQDQLWGPPSLLKVYQGLSPQAKSDRKVKLTSIFHLIPRYRMRGAIPPLSLYLLKTLSVISIDVWVNSIELTSHPWMIVNINGFNGPSRVCFLILCDDGSRNSFRYIAFFKKKICLKLNDKKVKLFLCLTN
jgi:hypothetical protein